MKSRQSIQNPSFYKKSNAWPAVLLLSTLSISIALTACGKKDAAGASGAGAGGMPPPEVIVAVAQRQPISQYVELAGRTNPFQLAPVIPQVGGVIQKMLFTQGDLVKAGQPLYQIDPAPFQAALETAQAAVQYDKANLAALKVTGARYKALIATNAVSQLDYDNAMQQIALAEATLAGGIANLRTAQINLDYTTIRSPITGLSGVSAVTPGALVTANQATSLVSITQMDPMYVDISQSSADMLKLRKQIQSGVISKSSNAPITITLEDGSSYPLQGRLELTNPSVDPTTGSVTLRGIIPNPSGTLLPGMYVKARLTQGVVNDGILLPQQAVTHDPQGNATVLVVAEDGTVSQRTIQAPNTQGNQWLVTSGLQNGERVILEGSQKTKPGGKVKATVAPADADNANPASSQTLKPVASPSTASAKS